MGSTCVRAGVGICLGLWLSACQDYPFEEVTSAVVRTKRVPIDVPQELDILFVIDNSRSMVGEQLAIAASFSAFTDVLEEKFAAGKWRLGVITTGMESEQCPACPPDYPGFFSCINETGENGRLQDLRGKLVGGTPSAPIFDFESDPACRVVTSDNLGCFFDPAEQRGTVLVGTRGCGIERGLAAVEAALSDALRLGPNADAAGEPFPREDGALAIVVVSDEEDCGAVGNVLEDELHRDIGQRACYYAANGAGPDGATGYPSGEPFRLESLEHYRDAFLALKPRHPDLVKFAAIVGVEDPADPLGTAISFSSDVYNADADTVCETPGCAAECGGDQGCIDYCRAFPGTRYVELAELFGLGQNGFVDQICRESFAQTLTDLGRFVSCPEKFRLEEEILSAGLANISVNGVDVPRWSCSGSSLDDPVVCSGPDDDSCPAGACVETWYHVPPEDVDPPDPNAPGGEIRFAAHYDPCQLVKAGDVSIELVYGTW